MMLTVHGGRRGRVVALMALLVVLPAFTARAAAQENAKPPLASLAKPSAVAGPNDPQPAAPAVTLPPRPAMPAPIAIGAAPVTVTTVSAPQPPRPTPPSVQPPRVSPPRVGGR